tara:strand:+ start:301 stop:582 length:282 start_codon:yes stop_codon:yes gene_type:complete
MENSQEISDLEKKIQTLELKIDKLINLLENVKKDTNKMSSHIEFIDNVYSRVSAPLFWICDKVNSIKPDGIGYGGITESFVKYNPEVFDNATK